MRARTLRAQPMTTRHLKPADYLIKILNARVYDVATESALELAPNLSRRLGNQVLLKREDQQPVHSFKLRGAYNKMSNLTPKQLKKGVICASAGNHAQGVALSASKLGTRAVIVMPTTTPQVKVDAVRGFGGEVVLFGDSYSDAHKHALTLQKKQGLSFVHPFDDPDVIAGQGTIAMEMLSQHQGPLDAVFCGQWRWRADQWCGQLHQSRAPWREGDRRANERLRRHDAVGGGQPTRELDRCGFVF